jgi:DNA-directed RNA polymerase subunit beta'
MVEIDEQTGFKKSNLIWAKKLPTLLVLWKEMNQFVRITLPVGAHLMVENGEKIKAGKVL